MNIKKLCFLWFIGLMSGVSSYACKPQINWGSTVSFCAGNSLVLSAFNANATYYWSTGATTSSITVTTSGQYYVTVTNVCGSTSDTIMVYVDQPLTVNLGPDRAMCAANSPTLTVPFQPSATYRWQDNSTSNQIAVTQSGNYHVRVTNACGSFYDTVNITLDNPPNVNLGPDINNCTSTTNTLSIPAAQGGKIQWSTGDTTTSIVVTSPGNYWVKVINGCGTFRDTIRVDHKKGTTLNIGDTINKCPTGSTVLSSNITGGTFLWNTNATTRDITITAPGAYWLKYTDNCGIYYDTVHVFNTGKARVRLGPDTTICDYDVFYLNAGNPGSTYNWSTGLTTRLHKVDTMGTYWVGVDNGCGIVYDTIKVEITATPYDSIGDTAYYCGSGYVDANAGRWGSTSYYYWDDGSTSRIHRYSSEGHHWVLVGNHCDSVQVDFYVKELHMPPLDLGEDTTLCGPLLLDTKLPPTVHKFEWSDGSTLPYNNITQPGIYWVKVTNPCGTFTDTILVNVVFPPAILSSKHVKICQGSSTTLVASPIDTITQFRWSNSATTYSTTVNQPGKYYLRASNICDTIFDSVMVSLDYPLQPNLGPDTTICKPQILYLDVSSYMADSIRWSTGSRNGGLPIDKSGTYWVKLFNSCGVFTDTIEVKVGSRPQKLFKEKGFCVGGSITLDATRPNVTSYYWNTGAPTAAITVNTPGWYWVEMTNECGITTDSVFIREDHPIKPFSIGRDTIFCTGTLWLEAPMIPGATYNWQDGTGSRLQWARASGTYWVTISNSCNSYTDSINILITGPPKLILGDSVKFCHGSIFTFNAQNPGSSYLWSTGSTNQYLPTDTAGKYWVTITNPCGTLTDTVQLITEFPLLNLELGKDTVICRGQTITLDAGYSNVVTKWNTGAVTRQITVSETGTYSVDISNSCGLWTDSIFVEVQEVPQFWLGPDSVICNIDGQVSLEGPPGMEVYEWSNGDKGQSTTFKVAGKKWLRVANKCFEYSDTIILIGEDPIEMDFGADTVLCFGQSLYISPGELDYQVNWYNGMAGATREITRSGTYWAWAQNSCGVFYDTIHVHFDYPLDPGISDTVVCLGDSAIVDINTKNLEITWFDGSQSKHRAFSEAGTYSATITNTCGTFYKDYKVDLSNCNCPLYMPDAFTPNQDGLNDTFKPVHSCDISAFNLQVFNRWGEEVFQSHDPEYGWDGTYKGRPAPIGVYNYTLTYGWMVYGVDREKIKRGVISILR